jgi:hypothetical protein
MFQWVGERLAAILTKPVKGVPTFATADPAALARALRPADILLIEGNSRIAVAIKSLTQSTWSHAVLYVGPIAGATEPDGETHVLIEADVQRGVISAPLSKYASAHTRICRPVGLSAENVTDIIGFVSTRIGHAYDLRNFFDLARYFLPTPPVPTRFRRRMIALGSGDPTRAICSTLIAQAFQFVHYPISPSIEVVEKTAAINGDREAGEARREEILHIRHYALFAPRDFDISPYFAIVKPTIESGFDFHRVSWAAEDPAAPA